ncbi:MAG: trypsin-like peptidase domain-containing protein [Acidimicrobiales bacterium]|nr:trypsin-like peptidase domain-containing protein [Acidimicrobiales bacterium]
MTEPGPPTLWEQPTRTVEPPKRPRTDPWTVILSVLGGVLLGTAVTFAILAQVGVFEEPTPTTIPGPSLTAPAPTGPPPTLGEDVTVADVAARVIPSTVFIESSGFLRSGSGSGVVYREDGYIVTNHHVVDGASSLSVVFADGARYPATLVGSDPLTDLAVLRVDRRDLTPVDLGSADTLTIGEPAIAVGSPLGLEGGPTVTSGIVSALDRALQVRRGEFLYGLVQTDAPIAPGSSGGALVDAEARLIGITTAIAVSDVGAEGLGFAVPVEQMVGVVEDLIATGTVNHARLGIEGTTVWARRDDGAEYPVGVGVTRLQPESPFGLSGGQVGDVITKIAGKPVTTIDDLLGALRRLRAHQSIPIEIIRADGTRTIDVALGSMSP